MMKAENLPIAVFVKSELDELSEIGSHLADGVIFHDDCYRDVILDLGHHDTKIKFRREMLILKNFDILTYLKKT